MRAEGGVILARPDPGDHLAGDAIDHGDLVELLLRGQNPLDVLLAETRWRGHGEVKRRLPSQGSCGRDPLGAGAVRVELGWFHQAVVDLTGECFQAGAAEAVLALLK